MTTDQILKIGDLWAVKGIKTMLLDIAKWTQKNMVPSLVELLEGKACVHNDNFQDASKLAEGHANDPIIKWIFQVIDQWYVLQDEPSIRVLFFFLQC
jgi:hypothetical protein